MLQSQPVKKAEFEKMKQFTNQVKYHNFNKLVSIHIKGILKDIFKMCCLKTREQLFKYFFQKVLQVQYWY